MIIRNGVIFIWGGTNASIPSGWSRVTDLDGLYPKGTADGVNPNVAGGAAAHTHTSAVHTHSAAAHTQTITFGAGSGGEVNTDNGADGALSAHAHANLTSGALQSATVSSEAATYGACSNDPENYTVIYVTPTTAVNKLPAGIICLADAAAPANFNICDGNNSTPNLAGKYLKGAAAGADAGATGGSFQNIHALSHVHTTSHSHAAATSGGATLTADEGNVGTVVSNTHAHSVALPAATPSSTNDVSLTTNETNIEPAYTKLLAIKAAIETAVPYNIIAMWKGLLSAIPAGWILCNGSGNTIDMRGRHLKITATLGEVGNIGGNNAHTHASQNHSHNIAHTHSSSINHSGLGNSDSGGSAGVYLASATTTHAISTNSVNLVLNDAATSADSSNNEPLYKTVAFIKLVSISSGNTFLINFIH